MAPQSIPIWKSRISKKCEFWTNFKLKNKLLKSSRAPFVIDSVKGCFLDWNWTSKLMKWRLSNVNIRFGLTHENGAPDSMHVNLWKSCFFWGGFCEQNVVQKMQKLTKRRHSSFGNITPNRARKTLSRCFRCYSLMSPAVSSRQNWNGALIETKLKFEYFKKKWILDGIWPKKQTRISIRYQLRRHFISDDS